MLCQSTTHANPIKFHFELFEGNPSIKSNNMRIIFPVKIRKSQLKIVGIDQNHHIKKVYSKFGQNTTIHMGEKILILEKFLEAEEF